VEFCSGKRKTMRVERRVRGKAKFVERVMRREAVGRGGVVMVRVRVPGAVNMRAM
jgi:hypothetical protein